MIFRNTLVYLIGSFCHRIRVLLENVVGFSLPIMAVDNIADISAKFGDFESIVFGLLLAAVLFHHLLWASNWRTSYCCPLSRSIGRRVVWIPDSWNLLKEKLSKLSKLRWPFAWLVVCRNLIDVDLNFTVERGTVGSLYWARNGVLGFRNLNDCICFPRSNWKTCSWYWCCCWDRLLFSLWFSHLVRIWNQT